jgi:hypothetical protein
MRYQVIVGNIGTVCNTNIVNAAVGVYEEYVKQSKSGYGRAGGEPVTLLKDNEPYKEYVPFEIDEDS